jgi:hypothetical protein
MAITATALEAGVSAAATAEACLEEHKHGLNLDEHGGIAATAWLENHVRQLVLGEVRHVVQPRAALAASTATVRPRVTARSGPGEVPRHGRRPSRALFRTCTSK